MRLEFTKMHGIGNDFIVVDVVAGQPLPTAAEVVRLAHRHYGVGCDQLLVIAPPSVAGADIDYRIFNADGSEAAQCGNGIRCITRYLQDRGRLPPSGRLAAATRERVLRAEMQEDGLVRVDMGVPRFEPAAIPLAAAREEIQYSVRIDGQALTFGAVSLGNPHAVLTVTDVESAPVAELGPVLERHALFPERVNVGFMQIVDRRHILLRVFERGAGETLACGTGACAAVVVGQRQGRLDGEVAVSLPGGELRIEWDGRGSLWMIGPAQYVFTGCIEL